MHGRRCGRDFSRTVPAPRQPIVPCVPTSNTADYHAADILRYLIEYAIQARVEALAPRADFVADLSAARAMPRASNFFSDQAVIRLHIAFRGRIHYCQRFLERMSPRFIS